MKKKLAGILLLAFLLPSVVAAQSLREEVDAQLDALTAGIELLIEAISTSVDISDTERLTLLQQTIVLSTAILEVRSILFDRNATFDDLQTPENLPSQIIAEFDIENQSAQVTVSTDGVQTGTYSYNNLFDIEVVDEFDDQIEAIRNVLAAELATELNFPARSIDKVLLITGHNPERPDFVSQNSDAAADIADEFGAASIINRVLIMPSVKPLTARIIFYSDREERMELYLERNPYDLISGRPEELDYTYEVRYYFSLIGNLLFGDTSPTLVDRNEELMESDLDEVLMIVSSRAPFTAAVEDFPQKLKSFLLNNNTTYTGNRDIEIDDIISKAIGANCFPETDTTVMVGYIDFLLNGMQLQHLPTEDIVEFLPSIEQDDVATGCDSGVPYF